MLVMKILLEDRWVADINLKVIFFSVNNEIQIYATVILYQITEQSLPFPNHTSGY
jgi:hypothetical protein